MISAKNILISTAVAGALLFSQSAFIVDQTKQALVLQFGELNRVIENPGLHFKIPFIQTVMLYEKRIMDFDMSEVAITTGDQKRMMVDTYTRYRIVDPIQFYRSVQPADEIGTHTQLQTIVSSTVRNVLGKIKLRNLLSEERSKIMHQINTEVQKLSTPLGLEIIDVRIKRTELPEENRKSVFARMNSELERIAKQNRANGAEKAQEIRSTAEKERTVLLAQAQRDGQINRGEGESKALLIVSETLGKDPDFYGFYRSLETYQATLTEGTTLMLSTDNELFKYFSHPEKVK